MMTRTSQILFAFLAFAALSSCSAAATVSQASEDSNALSAIANGPVKQRTDVMLVQAAMYALSDFETEQAIATLADSIAYPVVHRPLNGRYSDRDYTIFPCMPHYGSRGHITINRYPAAQVLARIGGPAVPAILSKIGSDCGGADLSASAAALEAIVGATAAEGLLREALNSASDPVGVSHITKTIANLRIVVPVAKAPADLNKEALAKARELVSTRLSGPNPALVVVRSSDSLGATVESHGQLLVSAIRLAELLHVQLRGEGSAVVFSLAGSPAKEMSLRSGTTDATQNGKPVSAPAKPIATNGDILVPMLMASDSFGVTVRWDSSAPTPQAK